MNRNDRRHREEMIKFMQGYLRACRYGEGDDFLYDYYCDLGCTDEEIEKIIEKYHSVDE